MKEIARYSHGRYGLFVLLFLPVLLSLALVGCGTGDSSGPNGLSAGEGELGPPPMDLLAPEVFQTATLGFGCFWGAEARMGLVEGVVRTRVGYSGGAKPNPTYGDLGDHTESVQVDYDPSVVSYQELLEVFFAGHDCSLETVGRQYMSVIFYHNAEQETVAREATAETEAKGGIAVATQILPVGTFYPAEDYHQKYALQNHEFLMSELRAMYPDFGDLVDSTAAARLNGYAYGVGEPARLRQELGSLGLSSDAEAELVSLVENKSGL